MIIYQNNFLFFIFLVLLIGLGGLFFQIWQIKRRLKMFFLGQKARDLEGVLAEVIKRTKKNEKEIKEIQGIVKKLEQTSRISFQKMSVIRFNPFKDTGGDQSFVIALLDQENNGLVISSLYTREGNRVYCKPITRGQSKYPLSKEEEKAIKKAIQS